MRRILWAVFIASVVFAGSIFATERYFSTYTSFRDVAYEFENVYVKKQDKMHKVFDRAPVVSEVAEGEIVFANESGTIKMYTRIGSALYSVTLS